VVLTSKLIDGTFPDYQRVIPTGNDKDTDGRLPELCPGRRPGVDDLSRAWPGGQARDCRRSDDADGEQSGFRQATEELAVDYDRDPMEIGFNAKYLLDITNQLSGSDAVFMLADPGSRRWCATPPATMRSTC
jgi:DNA polymerase-3 subunit beta